MTASLLRYVPALLGIDALLIVAHLTLGRIGDFWNLDEETNLPTWFSGLQLAFIALAALEAARTERESNEPLYPGPSAWAVLSAAFFYLSLDEVAMIHESLFRGNVMHLFPPGSLWVSVQPWQIVLAPLLAATAVLVLGLAFTRFTRPKLFVPALAGLGCWGCAVVMEALAIPLFIANGLYYEEAAVEEGLELLGATLLLLATCRYVEERRAGPIQMPPNQRRRFALAAGAVAAFAALGAAGVAIATMHDPARLYAYNGWYLEDEQMYPEAIASYEQAIQRNPRNIDSMLGIARCYEQLGEQEERLQILTRAVKQQPENARAWKARGMALHSLGRYGDAVTDYRRAIELRADYDNAYLNLGLALENLGRTKDAIAAYHSVVRLDPGDSDARERLRDLEAAAPPT